LVEAGVLFECLVMLSVRYTSVKPLEKGLVW